MQPAFNRMHSIRSQRSNSSVEITSRLYQKIQKVYPDAEGVTPVKREAVGSCVTLQPLYAPGIYCMHRFRLYYSLLLHIIRFIAVHISSRQQQNNSSWKTCQQCKCDSLSRLAQSLC
jgi:hypothetical protein